MKVKAGHRVRKRVVPFLLAAAMTATTMPVYMTPSVIVKASEQEGFGTAYTNLEAGTYLVPVALKNANNINADSMASKAVGTYAVLTVDSNKNATLELELKGITVGTTTGNAYNFKIYQENSTSSDKVDAAVTEGDEKAPSKITFSIPNAVKNNDGVYMQMSISAMPMSPNGYLKIDYANAKLLDDESLNVEKENQAAILSFGGYDVTTKVKTEKGKITDLDVKGSNFKGDFAQENESVYLKKAIKKVKDQMVGLYMNDQSSFENIDVISGATTTAQAIKDSVMKSLGLEVKEEVIPEAPTEQLKAGTYTIKVKNTTAAVDHSLSGGASNEKKVTATLYVDNNGKMKLSYPLISNTTEEPMEVLGFNGYYNSKNELTTEGTKVVKEDGVVTNVVMPLSGDKAEQTYKTNVYLHVPSMEGLNGEISGITFDHGKFQIDSTLTLYWDTLSKPAELNNQYLADGVYKVDAKMLKTNNKEASMADGAITHKVKLEVKDGKYYLTLNFKGMNIPMGDQTFHGYLNKIQYIEDGNVKDVTVNSVQKNTNGDIVTDEFGSNYPDLVTFPLTDEAVETGIAPMQVFIPIMDSIMSGMGTQKMNLSLDFTSLVKTTADDSDFNAEDVTEEAPKKEEPQKPSNTPSTSTTEQKPATSTTAKQQTTTAVKLAAVTGVKVKNSSKKTATVTWKKVKGATGYVVYRATKKNGKYKAVKTITKASTTKFKNTKLKKKKTYYYKVRAVKKAGKKVTYSSYSKTVSVKIKK